MALNFEPHTKPEKIVAGVWMVTQVFSFGFVVSAWCFASDVRKYSESFVVGTDAGPSVAFDVVWTSLMVLAASVFSGFVLPLWTRKYTNAMSFGALMGVVATMASVMLMTAVRYGQPSSAHKGVSHWSSANATAAFAALLFLSQIALIAFAAMYRHSVLKEVPNYAGAEQTTPHAQPQP